MTTGKPIKDILAQRHNVNRSLTFIGNILRKMPSICFSSQSWHLYSYPERLYLFQIISFLRREFDDHR